MEATYTIAVERLCYPVLSTGKAAVTAFVGLLLSVLGDRSRDSLHTSAVTVTKPYDAGVQVADPYYRSSTQIARIHDDHRIQH